MARAVQPEVLEPALPYREVGGFLWPTSDVMAQPVLAAEVRGAIPWALSHVDDLSVCVQAGGNVGLYPIALADHFRAVITLEPDPDNFACLDANISRYVTGRMIATRHAALGAREGHCTMLDVKPDNCGAKRITSGTDVPVMTIDGLGLTDCGLIWLDVEGSELSALQGAEDTIATFCPVIILELKGHGAAFGSSDEDCVEWLAARGYAEVERFGNDRLFKIMGDDE